MPSSQRSRGMKKHLFPAFLLLAAGSTFAATTLEKPLVFEGILRDGAPGAEASTVDLRAAIKSDKAIVLDARAYEEYAVSHIPGARAVPGRPGLPPSLYTADVNAVLSVTPDKDQAFILYCNGLNCGRSRRFADEMIKAGYRNVRRYQLGAPGWRALGGVMQVEKTALIGLLAMDRTAVLVDARDTAQVKPALRNAKSKTPGTAPTALSVSAGTMMTCVSRKVIG